jgi:hypothetical protein
VIVVLVNKGYKNNCFATFCKTQTPIFLKGKKIETTLPSSKEERLNGLALIAIKNNLLDDIQYKDLIEEFASKKASRMTRFM